MIAMSDTPKTKKTPGRPRKTTVPITLELLKCQSDWLDTLVDSGVHGTSREGILLTWITDRFRPLRDAGELGHVNGSSVESNVVPMKTATKPLQTSFESEPNQNLIS